MEQIDISVSKRQLSSTADAIITWNTGYKLHFVFDEEWEHTKTLKIVNDKGKVIADKVFTGDTVEIDKISGTNHIGVGIYAGDLKSTTPLIISCKSSILEYDGVPEPPTEDVYNQIMATLSELDKKINDIDGGATKLSQLENDVGFVTEAKVQEKINDLHSTVAEETEDGLFTKADKDLSNVDDTVFKAKAEAAGVGGGTVELSDYEKTENKTTEINADSTDEQYPTAKAVRKEVNKLTEELGNAAENVTKMLESKADKSDIPTKASQLENDAGYLTEHQDISGKADKSTTLSGYGITDAYTKEDIDSLMGDIETALDNIASLQASYIGGATS